MVDIDYTILGISAIDVSTMSVAKYGSHDRSQSGKNYTGKEEKKYGEIQKEKELNLKNENLKERKECSLQEHMQFMIWIGKRNITILNH